MQMMQMVDQKDQDLKKLTDFYKIKHVTASKKLRKTYEKNAKENDLEFLDSYRREYRPLNI